MLIYRSSVTFGRAKPETITVKEFGELPRSHEFLSISQRPNAWQLWLSVIRFDNSFPRVTIERYIAQASRVKEAIAKVREQNPEETGKLKVVKVGGLLSPDQVIVLEPPEI